MSTGAVYAIAVAFACGTMLAEALSAGAVICFASGAGGVAMIALAPSARHHGRRAALCIGAAATIALCLAGLRIAQREGAALTTAAASGADAKLTGEVLERPDDRNGSLRFLMGVSHATIDGRDVKVRERVQVSIRPPPDRIPRVGDRIVVDSRLAAVRSPPRSARTAAIEREQAARLHRAGVAARAFVRPDAFRVIGRSRNPIVRVAAIGQDAAMNATSSLPKLEAGLLLGVIVGDDSLLDPDIEANFRATGLSHLLAVSGANLAMFLGAILVGLRLLRTRIAIRVVVLGVATIAFMAITRFEPSVLRAGAMTAVGIAAFAAGARRYSVHAMGVACLGLMVWDPFLIHSGGFQLSALATLGLLTIAPRLQAAFGGGRIAAAVAISLGAQLAVGPLIALKFHSASLVALPANLLAVPAVGPATVLGFAATILGAVWAPAGRACALLAWPFLRWMRLVGEQFARVPGASIETPSGTGAIVVVAASLALILIAMRLTRFRLAPVALAITMVLCVVTWSRALAPVPPTGLQLITLNVGQGDATVVRAPGGATMLIDGGLDAKVLRTRLREHHVRNIDIVVLTHSHADHVNGLQGIFQRYRVGIAIDPGEETGDESGKDQGSRFDSYLQEVQKRGVKRLVARTGGSFRLGEAVVDVLGPKTLMRGTDSDPNNNSIVLRIRYAGTCVLLSGEVQEEAQDVLLEQPHLLQCPVFKIPHHGSGRALQAFYAATAAKVGVISVGANNYGHPALAPLAWMREQKMRILRTDQDGDVVVTLTAAGRIHVRK